MCVCVTQGRISWECVQAEAPETLTPARRWSERDMRKQIAGFDFFDEAARRRRVQAPEM